MARVSEFSERPIPDLARIRELRSDARTYPIDLAAPEGNEPAVDVRPRGIAGDNYYWRDDNPPYLHRAEGAIPELFVREGILMRLKKADRILRQEGLELYLFDAYRPVEVQNYFHDAWVPEYLRSLHPEWPPERIAEEVDRYWAKGAPSRDAIDPLSPPPHATGGVVDLTIREGGTMLPLDMGSAFDVVEEVSFTDHFERLGETRELTDEEDRARGNRRLLYWVMCEAGFVNNPNEWWHWGHGDQLSAKLSGAPSAVYSTLLF